MLDALASRWVQADAFRVWLWHRIVQDETGEGVISSAIAVLIMAFLGALMWVGFKAIWGDASSNTKTQVGRIGR